MKTASRSAVAFLSDTAQNQLNDVLIVVGVVVAVLGLYATMRSQYPAVARVMSWPFKAVWLVVRLLFLAPRWVWRQLWREPDGVTRGPGARAANRLRDWQIGVIHEVVAPMVADNREAIEANRIASKEQHDEQNEKIDAQTATMEIGFSQIHERLDRGSDIMAKHADAIADLQKHIDTAEGHMLFRQS